MALLHRQLTNFIGIEHELALQCPSAVKDTFTWMGILVLLVILFTYSGSIAATLHITNHVFVAIPLGLVIGWMLCNIYKFIFVVFSATSLQDTELQSKISFSKISACIYVSFIALFISIPIELFLFKNKIDADVVDLKKEEIRQFEIKTNDDYKIEETNLQKHIAEISHLGLENKSDLYYENIIAELEQEKVVLISTTSEKINASNYTHRKIELLFYKYPLSKSISLFIILLFLAPMLILFYNDNLRIYHDLKRNKDRQLIDKEYQHFKKAYSQILQTNFQKEVSWSEPYADPPYNHIKKTKSQPEYLSQKDLLTDIYDEEE